MSFQEIIDIKHLSEEESAGNQLFFGSLLAALRHFSHESVDLDDPETALQLLYLLDICPPVLANMVLGEFQGLTANFKRTLKIPSPYTEPSLQTNN